MHHLKRLDYYGSRFQYALFLGCGLASKKEIIKYNIPHNIFPRGIKTKIELEKRGIQCGDIVGDSCMLAFLESKIKYNPNGTICKIVDAYDSKVYIDIKFDECFAVAEKEIIKNYKIINNFEKFKEYLGGIKELHSSQIHPAILALLLGCKVKLYKKDWRFEDLQIFFENSFETPIMLEEIDGLDKKIIEYILRWAETLFCSIKRFC